MYVLADKLAAGYVSLHVFGRQELALFYYLLGRNDDFDNSSSHRCDIPFSL